MVCCFFVELVFVFTDKADGCVCSCFFTLCGVHVVQGISLQYAQVV